MTLNQDRRVTPCAALLLLAASSAAGLAGQALPVLEMNEVASHTLAMDGAVLGAQALPDGVLLWSSRSVLILGLGLQGGRTIAVPHSTRAIAAREASGGQIEIITVDPPRLVTFRDYRQMSPSRLLGPRHVTRARGDGLGWVWVSVDEDSVPWLTVQPDNSGDVTWPVDSLMPHSRPDGLLLSGSSLAPIPGEIDAPYRALLIRPGSDALSFEAVRLRESTSPESWVSLGLVELDRGYLRTLAALGSDERMLVLYDESGRFVRRTDLRAPIAFVASWPDERRAYAFRRGEAIQLVEYRWRWRSP